MAQANEARTFFICVIQSASKMVAAENSSDAEGLDEHQRAGAVAGNGDTCDNQTPESADCISVIVHMLGGDRWTLDVEPQCQVAALRDQLALLCGVPAASLEIMHEGPDLSLR